MLDRVFGLNGISKLILLSHQRRKIMEEPEILAALSN
jgi:hypothetical protein